MSKLLLVACQGLHSTSVMLPFNPRKYQHNKNPLDFETDANYYRVFTLLYINLRLVRCLIFIIPTKEHTKCFTANLNQTFVRSMLRVSVYQLLSMFISGSRFDFEMKMFIYLFIKLLIEIKINDACRLSSLYCLNLTIKYSVVKFQDQQSRMEKYKLIVSATELVVIQ